MQANSQWQPWYVKVFRSHILTFFHSSPLSPTKTRTNSIHDDLANAIDRKLSLNDENVFTPNITRKKSFASENVINGYAGYLTNSKYRSRDQKNTSLENVSEKQPWGINTWV